MDKIGATNWFWSFPSKEISSVRSEMTELIKKQENLEKDILRLKEREEELLKDRPETEERKMKLERFNSLKNHRMELETRLKDAKENDPEEIRKFQKACEEAKASANRWTDNLFSTMDWMKKQSGIGKRLS